LKSSRIKGLSHIYSLLRISTQLSSSLARMSVDSDSTVVSEWMVDLMAGWASGAAAVVACQPVDTVLTRWQATPAVAATAAAAGNNGGWRSLTLNLYQTAGWTALWRGASPMITAVPFQNALLMSGYGMGQRFYTGQEDTNTLSRPKQLGAIFVGGCTGGEFLHFSISLDGERRIQSGFSGFFLSGL
jgi:Mitochondrial carrier protein